LLSSARLEGATDKPFLPGGTFSISLASCLIDAQPLPVHCPAAAQGHSPTDDWSLPRAHFVQLMPILALVWVRSFIEPDF